MRDYKKEFENATKRFDAAKEVLRQQENTNAYTLDMMNKMELRITDTKEPTQDHVDELHFKINQMLTFSKILGDMTVEISTIGLVVFGFGPRHDLLQDSRATGCWSRNGLVVFEIGGNWAIGIGEPPMVGNETVRDYAQLNSVYRGKMNRDLI